jgi:hypothetical protein
MQMHCPALSKHVTWHAQAFNGECHAQSRSAEAYERNASLTGTAEVVQCLCSPTLRTYASAAALTPHTYKVYYGCHILPMRMSRSSDSMPSPLSMKW